MSLSRDHWNYIDGKIEGYEAGQWEVFNRLLNFINTQEAQNLNRAALYKEIMSWRPNALFD